MAAAESSVCWLKVRNLQRLVRPTLEVWCRALANSMSFLWCQKGRGYRTKRTQRFVPPQTRASAGSWRGAYYIPGLRHSWLI